MFVSAGKNSSTSYVSGTVSIAARADVVVSWSGILSDSCVFEGTLEVLLDSVGNDAELFF